MPRALETDYMSFQPVEPHPSLLQTCWARLAACCASRRVTLRGGLKLSVHEQLAEGAFSYVYRASAADGTQYALKQILCQTPEAAELAAWEVEVAQALRHRNVLPLADWTRAPHARGEMFHLATPLAERGTLRQRLDRAPPLGEDEALALFRGVCEGVLAMHEHQPEAWAHRDIKPENVLIGDDGRPLLTDLGSMTAARVEVPSRSAALTLQDQAAEHSSMAYRAPELYDAPVDSVVDERTDVWSLGCLLFAMAFKYSPYECTFDRRTGEPRVVDCTYLRVIAKTAFPPVAHGFSRQFCDLIRYMLQIDHTARPTVREVLARLDSHPSPEDRSEEEVVGESAV